MYKRENKLQTELDFDEFTLPFGGTLDTENRWIQLSSLIPWDEVEETYLRGAVLELRVTQQRICVWPLAL